MNQFSVLIKPASQKCNMKCSYCFYHDLAQKRQIKDYGLMTEATMIKIIDRVFAIDNLKIINFCFQGGEPTLIGIEYFQNFINYVNKMNRKKIKINYSLQTNGTLITQEFINLFKDNDFLIGLSIDGPKLINDYNRFYNDGQGTHQRIMQTLNEFKLNAIRFNVLVVVTKQIAVEPKKVYNFFKKNQVDYLQFIPVMELIGEKRGKENWSLTPKLYGEFLEKLFSLWNNDLASKTAPQIRQFENWIGILKGYQPESCDMRGVCSIQNIIEADGSVYPCDFYVFEKLKLGNVHNNSFMEMYQNPIIQKFINQSMVVPEQCQTCPYISLCRNGCLRQRDTMDNLNYYCEGYKYFFSRNGKRLKQWSRIKWK